MGIIKMKFATMFFVCVASFVFGQQGSLSVKVNKDTIAKDEVVTVEFLLDNLTGSFQAPDFRGFQVVSGPNTSSSFRMMNGEVSQKKSYSYALVPMDEGNLLIGPATVDNEGEIVSTEEIEIFVHNSYRSSKSSAKDRTFIYGVENDIEPKSQKKKRPLKKI